MKQGRMILAIVGTMVYAACSDNSKTVAKKEAIKQDTEELATGNFPSGTWRIDSVAENNVIKDRLTTESVVQIFNFRKNGVFSAMEVSPKVTKDRVIGTWKVEHDSLFIINEQGHTTMRYGYTINEATLILKGNFFISANIRKKPTFYLSKYKE